jgi:hypothetical protein
MPDHLDLAVYVRNFGSRPVPALLQQLLDFQNSVDGSDYSQAITLACIQPDDSQLAYCGDHRHQLIAFALCPGNGSIYLLWDNANNPDIEQWPVVVFDTEGGYTIIGRNLAEFLSTTWCDRPTFGLWANPFLGGYIPPEEGAHEEACESTHAGKFKLFLSELGLDTSKNPDAVVAQAQQALLTSLLRWHQPFEIRHQQHFSDDATAPLTREPDHRDSGALDM